MKIFASPQKRDDETKIGHQWFGKRQATNGLWLYHVNTDYWKEFTVLRYLQIPGTPGSATLYGSDPREHRMVAKHACAEYYDPDKAKWIRKDRNNHYMDCDVYAHCGAAMLGAKLGVDIERVTKPRAVSAAPTPRDTGDRVTRRKAAW